MKCLRCGAQLKGGCLYCSFCGEETQVMPDYNVLEDDYLVSLLKEENGKPTRQTKQETEGTPRNQAGSMQKRKKPGRQLPLVIACVILILLLIIGIGIKSLIDKKNASSYDYQVSMAQKELVDLNYENALGFYRTALSLRPSDIPVRMAMADIYISQKDDDAAMVLLMEVIDLEKTNQEAYRKLIGLYEKNQDYESIVSLASGITDVDILELFDGYLVAAPVFSKDSGKYEEVLRITLFSVDEDEIYYTTDGTLPDQERGIRYDVKKPIEFDKNGVYELQAICRNANGIYSEVTSATYTIVLAPPKYPKVEPDGGRITEETLVTIETEEDCVLYYTWDGTDPTESSSRYEEPLVVPEGNNILSVLVVNERTGLKSQIYRTNFRYDP
ncbi:MAG: chitobiase/beta-hexosaminidase C-terminal domain-containing protein [Clostridiales bacterium]|nr:chitobiase/beta-hexosaminidase C-terminal domain-containing protein [Clostridiales bacterium]